jgi:hypothetical protein
MISFLVSIALSNNKFDDIDIVFINGIQNDKVKHAIPSAIELSKAIQLPNNRVKAIYNTSRSFFSDILETYKYARYDGTNGGKDFTLFWKAVTSHNMKELLLPQNKRWRDDYLKGIIDGFIQYQGDYREVYNQIKKIRDKSTNKKLLILSHSEGTVVANLVMRELLNDYGDSNAKECTRLVSMATPVSTSVGIRNGGKYTTSNWDMIIGGIRPDVGSLSSNIQTTYDPDNDLLGHGLVDIYLNRGTGYKPIAGESRPYYRPHEHIRRKIISDINLMADEINENCIPCTDEEKLVMEDVKWLKSHLNDKIRVSDILNRYSSDLKHARYCKNKARWQRSWEVNFKIAYAECKSKRNIARTIDYFNKNIYQKSFKKTPFSKTGMN